MTAESAAEPVRIRSAAELFSVLTSGPLESQLAVLQSIVGDPTRPLTLGPHQGEDIVDILLRRIPESHGVLKQVQILCLMSYQDPRTTEFMVEEFARSRDAGTVLRLGQRLSVERGFDFFLPFLWDERSAQALASARLCCQSPRLSPRERLRVAILLDGEYAPPEINSDTLDVWLQELAGKHRLRTRAIAQRSGRGILALWSRWSELHGEEKLWLIRATATLDPTLFRGKLVELLRQPQLSYEYVQLAISHGVELPASLLESPQPMVRAAAIQSGHADAVLERYLTPSTSLPEVLAAMSRGGTDKLLWLLSDARWQVRAMATNLLAQSKEAPLEALQEKARSGSLEERVAAVESLRRLGQEEWLEEVLGQ
jgi:hypothetical protein